jgi:ribosomal protein S18 acetylase RimI-like enzyme
LGVGSRLVEKAVEIAKKQNGCKTVSVQVPTADDALLQLFTKCGFEKQQETVKTDTTECFVLVKTL